MIKKRLLSFSLAVSIFAGISNVFAAPQESRITDTEDIRAQMEQKAAEEGIDIVGFSVPYDGDIEATPEPANNEPQVHEEEIIGDIELQEESECLLDDSEISLLSTTTDNESVWDSLFTKRFGDDYLAPYRNNRAGQHISGKSKRLIIEETDLSLSGKNGLDLNITRRYDNQYYNTIYGRTRLPEHENIKVYRHGYGFTNDSTNEDIYVLFVTPDDFYLYMKDGLTVSSMPNYYRQERVNGRYINYYIFETLYRRKSDSGIHLSYNSSMEPETDWDESDQIYDLTSRHLLPKDNKIGCGWDFMFPEASLHRYEYDTDTSGSTKHYNGDYIGAFRDIEGNVFSLKGYENYIKYGDGRTTFSSSFHAMNSCFFSLTAYYATQNTDGIEYNFVVEDSNGLTYYFFNTGLQDRPQSNQSLYITALCDRYGNKIKYEYGNGYGNAVYKRLCGQCYGNDRQERLQCGIQLRSLRSDPCVYIR